MQFPRVSVSKDECGEDASLYSEVTHPEDWAHYELCLALLGTGDKRWGYQVNRFFHV